LFWLLVPLLVAAATTTVVLIAVSILNRQSIRDAAARHDQAAVSIRVKELYRSGSYNVAKVGLLDAGSNLIGEVHVRSDCLETDFALHSTYRV
jgi:hypothetical protein